MAKFTVARREVHICFVEIEADNPMEAIEKVSKGRGEALEDMEYSHDLDPDTWTVDEEPDRPGVFATGPKV